MRRTNFDDYLFRCSSLGKLMTNSKVKSDPLSKTTKTYLQEIHKEELFNRKKELVSKYLDKGIQVEEQSISLYSEVEGKLFIKNKERFNNAYLTGEPDSIKGKIIDIKSSWDFSTFPLHETEITNNNYYWQLQGYMALTGLKTAELVYCLVDTPDMLVEDEKRRTSWKTGHLELPDDISAEIERNMQYTDIPKKLRVKKFSLDFDSEAIDKLYERIGLCRAHLNTLSEQIADLIKVEI